MSNMPTFFLSHARQDREMPGRYLVQFFKDLEKRLAARTGVDLERQKLGTIDMRIQHGGDWDDMLAQALASDKAFIAILSPLYFRRPNCGNELAIFIMRSPGVNIDSNGSLTGVQNVLPIRWYPENFYNENAEKDARIPAILRRIEDTPADELDNSDRSKAIERYRRKGMENCVNTRAGYYRELLAAFVECIMAMPDLPPAGVVGFATAHDAFKLDWRKHFGTPAEAIGTVPEPVPSTRMLAPRALSSVAVFYVTRRPLLRDSHSVDFADFLVTDVVADTDPAISDLLTDVREAGVAEGLDVFHCATDPPVPDNAKLIIDRLARLGERRVLTALVVDPAIWPGSGGADAKVVQEIIASDRWAGPVLLAALDGQAPRVDADARGLPARLIALPRAGEVRVAALRFAFVDARGRTLRAANYDVPGTERLPVIENIRAPEAA
jgi:hypothetical protein